MRVEGARPRRKRMEGVKENLGEEGTGSDGYLNGDAWSETETPMCPHSTNILWGERATSD